MKHSIKLFALLLISSLAIAQENRIAINGSYIIANYEDTDNTAPGWRVSGVYEFNPFEKNLIHGVSVGYAFVKAQDPEGNNALGLQEVRLNSIPIYYVPKYLFGTPEQKFRPFIKGALGWHWSEYQTRGRVIEMSGSDSGPAIGGGFGAQLSLGEKMFMLMDYEGLFLVNGFYRDGLLNNFSFGVGFKF